MCMQYRFIIRVDTWQENANRCHLQFFNVLTGFVTIAFPIPVTMTLVLGVDITQSQNLCMKYSNAATRIAADY